MGKPDKTDLKDDLRRGAIHIRQTADAIVEAERQRAGAVQTGDLEICRKVDRRLADLSSDLRALEERQSWLAAARIKADTAAAEAARAEAIERTLQPQCDAIIELAARLETAVAELGRAYGVLDKAVTELHRTWPAAVPHTPFYRYSLMDIKQRLAGAMQYAANGNAFDRLAEFARTYGERTTTISESVRRALTAYLRDLKQVPLPAAKEKVDG
jgi:hypothetical protein